MLGEELRPGLRTWAAHHEEWGQEVRGFAIVGDGRLILVDPLLVGDQWEELATLREGRALDLLATLHYHVRSGAELRERHPDATLWAFEGDREKIAERAPVDRTFAIGEELPGGLVAIGPLPRGEVVFWDAGRAALFAGDVLLGDGAEGRGSASARSPGSTGRASTPSAPTSPRCSSCRSSWCSRHTARPSSPAAPRRWRAPWPPSAVPFPAHGRSRNQAASQEARNVCTWEVSAPSRNAWIAKPGGSGRISIGAGSNVSTDCR